MEPVNIPKSNKPNKNEEVLKNIPIKEKDKDSVEFVEKIVYRDAKTVLNMTRENQTDI